MVPTAGVHVDDSLFDCGEVGLDVVQKRLSTGLLLLNYCPDDDHGLIKLGRPSAVVIFLEVIFVKLERNESEVVVDIDLLDANLAEAAGHILDREVSTSTNSLASPGKRLDGWITL